MVSPVFLFLTVAVRFSPISLEKGEVLSQNRMRKAGTGAGAGSVVVFFQKEWGAGTESGTGAGALAFCAFSSSMKKSEMPSS